MDGELRVLLTEEDADAEQIAVLTGHLRSELLHLDVADVTAMKSGDVPPAGARALDAIVVGGLVVALGKGLESIGHVVSAILGWLGRGEGTRRKVRIELAGDVLELEGATSAEQQRLITTFLERHSPDLERPSPDLATHSPDRPTRPQADVERNDTAGSAGER